MEKTKIFFLDNMDSFTYNLVDEFAALGFDIEVYRNDVRAEHIVSQINRYQGNTMLVLSPGPGKPSEAGCMPKLIQLCAGNVPIIGICLGFQALVEYYGGQVGHAPEVIHGKSSLMVGKEHHNIFANIGQPMRVGRYHSLAAINLPTVLDLIGFCGDIPMVIEHKSDRVLGFQFHPESILTPHGSQLLKQSIAYLIDQEEHLGDDALSHVLSGHTLNQGQAKALFTQIMRGDFSDIELSAFLSAMKIRSETVNEIIGAAAVMLENATIFDYPKDGWIADNCGTGGDGTQSINISTIACLVAVAAGVKMAKHGNRSVSSKSGSADLLEHLGINIELSPEKASQCLEQVGMSFLFAPLYHKAVKNVMPIRKALRTRTIFNLLGPIVNPARPNIQLLGVYDSALCLPIAQVLRKLGCQRAMVVHGSGMDEICLHGVTSVAHLHDGHISEYTLSPEDFGLQQYSLQEIKGGDPKENAKIALNILGGKGTAAQNAWVAANVAPILVMAEQAKDLKQAVQKALDILDNGQALALLKTYGEFSHA